ncbi:YggS family pyridoxal phosphate-dependent enzyme [Natronoglycomyces albus]|uniref:Pyridoxal phosphate homeostasis protein n=1 Tax=Natronoglycomyces albus TaxID=2811108 RepID=A0A895XKB3_9ACTN|nr:YggS family pyridoxal phosphate-dependent enzyme [Natronoglycomyces albus]QSB04252.1 YggS family pyridoxal phosphate-dependent enzyme [Natronoglycomyces albus]
MLPPSLTPTKSRQADIDENVAAARQAIAHACRAAGRSPESVRLVAITKTFPAVDAVALVRAGITDIGENREQEAAPKAAELTVSGVEVAWHFVGQLQRNKARSVARFADWIHSVDRDRLVSSLDRAAAEHGRRPRVLLQVNLDGAPGRGGVAVSDVAALAESVAKSSSLTLSGVMGVAPPQWEPKEAFDLLAECSHRVRRIEANASEISAGMSGDFEEAIACGATMIRLGGKLLGRRDRPH